MARHCTPQNPTHQIAIVALRKAAPVSADFGPDRVGRVAAIAASSASTASTKASMSLKASHEAGEVLAVLTAVPICCGSDGCCEGRRHSPSPSRASALIHLKVASRSAPAGTTRLRTDTELPTHFYALITAYQINPFKPKLNLQPRYRLQTTA